MCPDNGQEGSSAQGPLCPAKLPPGSTSGCCPVDIRFYAAAARPVRGQPGVVGKHRVGMHGDKDRFDANASHWGEISFSQPQC